MTHLDCTLKLAHVLYTSKIEGIVLWNKFLCFSNILDCFEIHTFLAIYTSPNSIRTVCSICGGFNFLAALPFQQSQSFYRIRPQGAVVRLTLRIIPSMKDYRVLRFAPDDYCNRRVTEGKRHAPECPRASEHLFSIYCNTDGSTNVG